MEEGGYPLGAFQEDGRNNWCKSSKMGRKIGYAITGVEVEGDNVGQLGFLLCGKWGAFEEF